MSTTVNKSQVEMYVSVVCGVNHGSCTFHSKSLMWWPITNQFHPNNSQIRDVCNVLFLFLMVFWSIVKFVVTPLLCPFHDSHILPSSRIKMRLVLWAHGELLYSFTLGTPLKTHKAVPVNMWTYQMASQCNATYCTSKQHVITDSIYIMVQFTTWPASNLVDPIYE